MLTYIKDLFEGNQAIKTDFRELKSWSQSKWLPLEYTTSSTKYNIKDIRMNELPTPL